MPLKRRTRLGQYRIEGLLSKGGFAEVYRAYDTVEGIRVAIKLPLPEHVNPGFLTQFRREVRLVAGLDHQNILPIKTAGLIGEHFAIVTPLGIESLGDRLQRRMARTTALGFAEQLLEGLACAHRRKIAHLDVKPENLILFPDRRLRLADFGLARIVHRTLAASGSGTVGYVAPEQALGRPALHSDVFSAGLILWQLMAGSVPDWPFRWPYPNAARAEAKYSPGLVRLVRRATLVDERKRFPNAVAMLAAYRKLGKRLLA
ncbi:MAG: serine/threonine-protein kinase [Planctomycetota bacterium]|nr:serine/threonine-protein kinase [Planctomycetota bacterium]